MSKHIDTGGRQEFQRRNTVFSTCSNNVSKGAKNKDVEENHSEFCPLIMRCHPYSSGVFTPLQLHKWRHLCHLVSQHCLDCCVISPVFYYSWVCIIPLYITYSESDIFMIINDWQASSHRRLHCWEWVLWNKILEIFWIKQCLSVIICKCRPWWIYLRKTLTWHGQAVIWY